MKPISEFELQAMQARTARAINPKAAQAKDEAARQKWASGEEKSLQDEIQKYAEMRGCYVLRARMDRKSTLNHAHPDLTIWGNGQCLCLEAKANGGRLSDAQTEALGLLSAAGAKAAVVFDLKTAIGLIKHHLKL